MGRSSETFSKKENERKKQKKRKDKLERKEERKANSDKGKSFEDMLAYVDEHGNLTTTPPDPKKKIQIREEDIKISVAREVPVVEDVNRTGTVTFFNDNKGYGFIKDAVSGVGIFVHINAANFPIKEGNKVAFQTEDSPRGLQAVNVTLQP